ncbi:unnamed protein product [Dracunculus medinensis]|uniref:Sodium/potassium-transporting ATPase subunit beta-1-interacting protein n=1 Tax=Dracunculus medinensis TaxID=318479 RepID=A0A0N4U6K3_DRAME|nr:unnamed protein product [Dracunculus medinensis]
MCESSSSLLISLSVWLILSAARQVFDLIGKLWVLVIFNLLQIVSVISGIFAACQQRLLLLIAFTFCSLLSIIYNALLLLWYKGFFGDNMRSFISAGLPYSHSFFIRYTPMCSSYFNLSILEWVQTNCLVQYKQIESLQCIIHIILATLSILLSIKSFCKLASKRKCVNNKFSVKPYNFHKMSYNILITRFTVMISCIIVKLPLQHNSAKNFDDRLALNRSSGSNMTSLISFDPKSNTLIRVREHVEEDLDDGFLISDYKNGKSIYRQVSIIHKLQYFF